MLMDVYSLVICYIAIENDPFSSIIFPCVLDLQVLLPLIFIAGAIATCFVSGLAPGSTRVPRSARQAVPEAQTGATRGAFVG